LDKTGVGRRLEGGFMDICKETLKETFLHTFAGRFSVNKKQFSPKIQELKDEAFLNFKRLGFPTQKAETWRNTNLDSVLTNNFTIPTDVPKSDFDVKRHFKCEFESLDTEMMTLVNGWCSEKSLRHLKNGVVFGSLKTALEEFPEIVEKHLGEITDIKSEGLNALNSAFFYDGIFIYIPDNVAITQALQIVNIYNSDTENFVQPRNLIVMGKNSSAKIIQCDDSLNHKKVFSNSITEAFVGEFSKLEHYKLQNINDDSAFVNTINFQASQSSDIQSYQVSLNGGILRNNIHVTLTGKGGNADISGLYLMDKGQHIDNLVYIKHAESDCTSSQIFKGILDDRASASFNGHVYVAKDAQRTSARQNSRNILLTDKAKIDAKPFLEIYADDVKCSHGATVGQLDEEAMFYLRSRGIGQSSARMLLMYAFAAEIISDISIESLRSQIDDMIKKRLRGELNICEQCVLQCSHPEHSYDFKIDISKI